jgi:hypothetical protein
MASFAKDRFDAVPDELARVGAHRAPRPAGRGWIGFFIALAAIGVLVFAGLFTVSKVLDIDLGLPIFPVDVTPTPTPTPTPTMDPVLDPSTIDPARQIRIDVLNGTPIAALHSTVGAQLIAAGWPIGTQTQASQDDIEETTVFYSDPLNEDVARGLVLALGVGDIRLVAAETFPGAPLTIVLGADYQTPTAQATTAP